MIRGFGRALRFGMGWKAGAGGVEEEEMEVRRSDGPLPATLLRPRTGQGKGPAWVVLHGITRPGRHHPTLLRFVRALAGSGASVLVPEIPEWRELHLAPEAAAESVRAAVLGMAEMEGHRFGPLGLMGFSFGVPQVLRAAADPGIAPHLGAVTGFGGYCDFSRTLRFLFRGTHEWKGRTMRGDPDPYGRWVVGGNFLPGTPSNPGSEPVAEALLVLAREAGDMQVGSWEGALDARKTELEEGLAPEHRELFRSFAPPAGELPGEAVTERLVPELAAAARAESALFDPLPSLGRIHLPVRLIHGREDRLIPYTETLRLRESFPSGADVRASLTGLFAHSQREGGGMGLGQLGEQANFVRMLSELLGLV